ncbi:MAG: hypothetical protein WA061_03050 [Microgenomates group bacterium]
MAADRGEYQSPQQQFEQIRQQVNQATSEQLVAQLVEVADSALEVQARVAATIKKDGSLPESIGKYGDEHNPDSLKAKAIETKTAVQKILIAAKGNRDLPLLPKDGTIVDATMQGNAKVILWELSDKLNAGEKVSEQTSPYIYNLIHKVLTGQTSTIAQLVQDFKTFEPLHEASEGVYKRVQEAMIATAQKISSVSKEQAQAMFGVEDSSKPDDGEIRTKKQLEELEGRVQTYEKEFGDLIIQIRTNKNIKPTDAERIVQMLIHTTGPADKNFMEEKLIAAGFSSDQVEKLMFFSHDYKKLNELKGRQNYRYLEQYGLLTPELKSTFDVNSVKSHLLVEDEENPGMMKLSDVGRRLLKRRALGTLNQLMKHVDENPDTDFHQNFSDLREGQAYFEIQQLIGEFQTEIHNSQDLRNVMGEKNMGELEMYLKSGVIQELAREKSLRELFHTMGIYIKQLPPDKYGEFISRYNLSDIDSVVTSDFSGKIISLAMNEYERYIQFDRMKNQGNLRTSLFAGKSHLDMMYKANDDRTNLQDRLKATLKGLKVHIDGQDAEDGKDPRFTTAMGEKITGNSLIQKWDLANIGEFEDWEIERALKYAQGIHLTQTIRGFEIIASGRPPQHFRGSADNMVDMAGVLNPNWKWQMGRGGPQNMPVYREAMYADMIKKRPEKNLGKRIWNDLFGKDHWNPEEVHDTYGKNKWNTDEKIMEKWAEIEDQWLYKDISFRKMIKLMGLGGLAGRGGWRLEGFRAGIDSQGSEYAQYVEKIQDAILQANAEALGKKDLTGFNLDQKTYDQLAKSVGVGSRFFFDQARGDAFAKEELWKYLEAKGGFVKDDTPARELDKLWYEYTFGEHGNDDIITLPGGEKMTLMELDEVKVLTLRGLNFRDLMKRSPMDFLNSLINISPELLTKGLGGVGDEYFIFNEDALEKKVHELENTKGKREELLMKIKVKQADMRRMWGTDKQENRDHLLAVRGFYKSVEEWGEAQLKTKGKLPMDKQLKDAKKEDIEKHVWEPLYRTMDLAIEKVRLHNSPEMSREDIIVMNENGEGVDAAATEAIRDMFFGAGDKKGLVTYFNSLNENCGVDADGKEMSVGQWTDKDRGFFYHMGRSWYNELGHNFPPDTSDVDWRYILHNMGANSGENMVKRLWGDLNAYNGVMSKLMSLDDILAKCASSNSLEKIMEIHAGIRGLKGICGDEPAYEMQFYLAQVVARYFQENSMTRMPGLGMLARLAGGNTISLSKIYGGAHAMTMSTDGINAYFQSLGHGDYIAEEGIYGVERLQQALGADWQKMVITEMIPNIATALTLFLLYKYLKDAMDETGGKKKK